MQVTWVLEPQVFSQEYRFIPQALREAGHAMVTWDDDWWRSGAWPRIVDHAVVFHGSLGNAARVRSDLPWIPGAYCDVEAFHCSKWYPGAQHWLLHRQWRILPAKELAEKTTTVLASLGSPDCVFIRPDSPLKPFSGRVLQGQGITLEAMDYGFYYDDERLPVIVAPVRSVGREWRYVVVDRKVIAGSAYQAAGRSALADNPGGAAWTFATEIAAGLVPPEDVYVMDICEADGRLWLLELNPFSGADLYACDPRAVVTAVSEIAKRAASHA
jgi:hypothetical protein